MANDKKFLVLLERERESGVYTRESCNDTLLIEDACGFYVEKFDMEARIRRVDTTEAEECRADFIFAAFEVES